MGVGIDPRRCRCVLTGVWVGDVVTGVLSVGGLASDSAICFKKAWRERRLGI